MAGQPLRISFFGDVQRLSAPHPRAILPSPPPVDLGDRLRCRVVSDSSTLSSRVPPDLRISSLAQRRAVPKRKLPNGSCPVWFWLDEILAGLQALPFYRSNNGGLSLLKFSWKRVRSLKGPQAAFLLGI